MKSSIYYKLAIPLVVAKFLYKTFRRLIKSQQYRNKKRNFTMTSLRKVEACKILSQSHFLKFKAIAIEMALTFPTIDARVSTCYQL